MGPRFRLQLFDTGKTGHDGKYVLAYKLTQISLPSFDILGNYGHGWETVTAEETRELARTQLKCYRENEPQYSHRIRQTVERIVLFEGEDFRSSPLHAVDSDETVEAILGFLTLRPGDTDSEYFVNYTDVQREFCSAHAEYLNVASLDRFGQR